MAQLNKLEPSVGTVFSSVWRHRVVMMICLALGLGMVTFYYFMITPVYEATASLAIGQNAPDSRTDTTRRPDATSTLAHLAESEEVIRDAVGHVGLSNLRLGDPTKQSGGLGGRLRGMLFGVVGDPARISPLDVAVVQLKRGITVRTDPNSDVIRISFKSQDPAVAASFANALAQSFIERQLKLIEMPGAADFFRKQADRFDAEVSQRSQAFEEFMRKENAYSVEDQRGLLLRRRSDLAALQSTARGTLADKQGQKGAIVSQLKLLKSVTLSPYVTGLVNSLGGGADEPAQPAPDGKTPTTDNPPLLMVKVYQDVMVNLFN